MGIKSHLRNTNAWNVLLKFEAGSCRRIQNITGFYYCIVLDLYIIYIKTPIKINLEAHEVLIASFFHFYEVSGINSFTESK